jgi:hypothetical protein
VPGRERSERGGLVDGSDVLFPIEDKIEDASPGGAAATAPAKKRRAAGTAQRPPKVDEGLESRKRLMQVWQDLWIESGRPAAYVPVAKDWTALKKAWGMADRDEEEVERRMSHLLEAVDPWIAENASLPMLASRWNNLSFIPGANGHRRPRNAHDSFKELVRELAQEEQEAMNERRSIEGS